MVDAASQQVLRFDSAGRLVASFSARDQGANGPHRIDYLGVTPRGEWAAFDIGAQQLLLLDTTGTHRGAVALPALEGATWPAVIGMTSEGRLVFRGRALASPGLPDGVRADSDRLHVVDPATGRVTSTWDPLPSFRFHVARGYTFTLPYEPARSNAVVDSLVAWAPGTGNVIMLANSAGRVSDSLHATFSPCTVPASEPGYLRAHATERRGMMGSRGAFLQVLRESQLPDQAPFITALVGMPPGELLVRGWTPAESTSVTWQRLSLADSVLGEFTLPATARILAARAGRILVADADKERMSLAEYRLDRTSP